MMRDWWEVVKLSRSWRGKVRIDQGEEMYGALMRYVKSDIFLVKELFVVLIVALSSVLAACSPIMTLQV